jgi:hypothetical protein
VEESEIAVNQVLEKTFGSSRRRKPGGGEGNKRKRETKGAEHQQCQVVRNQLVGGTEKHAADRRL